MLKFEFMRRLYGFQKILIFKIIYIYFSSNWILKRKKKFQILIKKNFDNKFNNLPEIRTFKSFIAFAVLFPFDKERFLYIVEFNLLKSSFNAKPSFGSKGFVRTVKLTSTRSPRVLLLGLKQTKIRFF